MRLAIHQRKYWVVIPVVLCILESVYICVLSDKGSVQWIGALIALLLFCSLSILPLVNAQIGAVVLGLFLISGGLVSWAEVSVSGVQSLNLWRPIPWCLLLVTALLRMRNGRRLSQKP